MDFAELIASFAERHAIDLAPGIPTVTDVRFGQELL